MLRKDLFGLIFPPTAVHHLSQDCFPLLDRVDSSELWKLYDDSTETLDEDQLEDELYDYCAIHGKGAGGDEDSFSNGGVR